ncbi:hypothetical protein DPMN_142001 [Dreissena polymorpha]|uniref:Uncharacterized protein n=1 Tax=Dreissena polymorpha TaxID=45954 RepID=A0A9D4GEK8_DREPO|nr:hypothetical protein DPMN_142001 [Dreissena polymorpha]
MFTTVTVPSTLQIPESETTIVTHVHKYDNTSDYDYDSYFYNNNFGDDFFDIFSDSSDSSDEIDQDYVNNYFEHAMRKTWPALKK